MTEQVNERPWKTMDSAPKDCTTVELIVFYPFTTGEHPIQDACIGITIGSNNSANIDEEVDWQIVGWCWSHDHWTEGKGVPLAWRECDIDKVTEEELQKILHGLGVEIPND